MATDPGDDDHTESSDIDAPDPADSGPPESADDGSGVNYEVTDDEQTWGVLAHASAFAGLVIPLGNVLGPLLVWLVKRGESRFVDENGKASLNFQITWTILMFVAFLTVFIAIGFVLVPLLALAWLILVVIGAARASGREVYDYPLTFEFVS